MAQLPEMEVEVSVTVDVGAKLVAQAKRVHGMITAEVPESEDPPDLEDFVTEVEKLCTMIFDQAPEPGTTFSYTLDQQAAETEGGARSMEELMAEARAEAAAEAAAEAQDDSTDSPQAGETIGGPVREPSRGDSPSKA